MAYLLTKNFHFGVIEFVASIHLLDFSDQLFCRGVLHNRFIDQLGFLNRLTHSGIEDFFLDLRMNRQCQADF